MLLLMLMMLLVLLHRFLKQVVQLSGMLLREMVQQLAMHESMLLKVEVMHDVRVRGNGNMGVLRSRPPISQNKQ